MSILPVAATPEERAEKIDADVRAIREAHWASPAGRKAAADFETWRAERGLADSNGHMPDGATPPYPVAALPCAVARFVTEAADALAAPPEFVALPLLVFAAGAIGNTRYVQVKRGYTQPAILWGVTVGPPGSVKTPALETARAPLSALQRAAKGAWDEAVASYEINLAHWQDLPKADRAAINKPMPPAPLEHFLTTDSTKEALAVMAATSAGAAAYRDEIGAWVAAFDAYRSGRGGDRQDMLSLWSGVMLKIDRKSAAPIVAERPAISIVGGIQPDRLPALAGEAGQDGFLDRFLWAYPEVGPMRWTDAEVDAQTERAIADLFGKLRAGKDESRPDGWAVTLAPDAFAAWVDWHDDNAAALEGATPVMRGVYAKLPNQLLRLALVLHCLNCPEPDSDVLPIETLRGAVALADYHLAHAVRVMAHFPATATATAHYPGVQGRIIRIIRKYEQEKSERWISRSAIYNGLRNVNATDFGAALDALERQGAVERRKRSTRTKAVEEWRILEGTPFVLSDYSDHSDPDGASERESR